MLINKNQLKTILMSSAFFALAFLSTYSAVRSPEIYAIPDPKSHVVYEIYALDLSPIPERPLYLIHYTKPIKLSDRDRDCLARNVYYEAGVESLQGKIAVAQVTWNRVRHPDRWGNSVCQTVFQRNQFSWTKDPKKRNSRPHGPLWQASLEAVEMFVAGARIKNLNRSYYYHADYVNPRWANNLDPVVKIDTHIFYQYKN